jgi:hypothetical protein
MVLGPELEDPIGVPDHLGVVRRADHRLVPASGDLG